MASDLNFDLLGFHRERQSAFRAHFETKRDGLFDIFQRQQLGYALTDAAGNGRTLGNPDSVLVTVKGNRKFYD